MAIYLYSRLVYLFRKVFEDEKYITLVETVSL